MQNKKWWLVPVVLVILVVRALIIIGSAILSTRFSEAGSETPGLLGHVDV